jgi:nicotinate-nucleotide pyrophosphorylase (carboxylating)
MQRLELERFLSEDLGEWDDSSAIVPEIETRAVIIAREECIISGLSEGREILEYLSLESEALYDDGERVPAGAEVMEVWGSARGILQAERLVLNILARMSGISTLTRECVERVRFFRKGVRIACTRKTTPGFRVYEKKAVLLGGGDPHRLNLSGAVLIKDNHINILGLEECVRKAKSSASFTKKIEVEVENLDDMLRAAELGVDIIMFDNMEPSEICRGIDVLRNKGLRERLILEASGGISPANLEDYASTGVDVISLGALTRDAKWIDFSLEVERGQGN